MFNEEFSVAGKMVQWLGALSALAEDLDSVPHTHTASPNHLQL